VPRTRQAYGGGNGEEVLSSQLTRRSRKRPELIRGSWSEPQPKMNLANFKCYITPLVEG